MDLKGAALDFESYAPERRAIRVQLLQPTATITFKPVAGYMNPVLEFANVRSKLASVKNGERVLPKSQYAWDGRTLWLNVRIDQPTTFSLHFE